MSAEQFCTVDWKSLIEPIVMCPLSLAKDKDNIEIVV